MRPFLLVLLLAILVSAPSIARARPGASLVALVTTDPSAELSHRVEEQLEAEGFDVLVLNPPAAGSVGPNALQQTARNVSAFATVRVVPLAQTIQVWVSDPGTGKSVFREIIPTSGQMTSDASAALQAIELFRACLVELHSQAPPPPPPPPPPACPPPVPEKPFLPRLGLATGLSIDTGLAGRPALGWSVALWVGLADRIGARLIGVLNLSPGQIESRSYGNIAVDAQLAGAELTYDIMPSAGPSVPVVGLGLLGANVVGRGVSPQGNAVSLYNTVWTAVPFVHLGEGLRLVPGLRARADVLAGWSLAPVELCAARDGVCSEVAGRWGQPYVDFTAGFEVLFSP